MTYLTLLDDPMEGSYSVDISSKKENYITNKANAVKT